MARDELMTLMDIAEDIGLDADQIWFDVYPVDYLLNQTLLGVITPMIRNRVAERHVEIAATARMDAMMGRT